MSAEREPTSWSAAGPPWYYGRLICDLWGCGGVPTYWWRAFGEVTGTPSLVMVCDAGFAELTGPGVGIPADEFVPGALVSTGHWRAAA